VWLGKAPMREKAGCLSSSPDAVEPLRAKPGRAGLWRTLDSVAVLIKDNQPCSLHRALPVRARGSAETLRN